MPFMPISTAVLSPLNSSAPFGCPWEGRHVGLLYSIPVFSLPDESPVVSTRAPCMNKPPSTLMPPAPALTCTVPLMTARPLIFKLHISKPPPLSTIKSPVTKSAGNFFVAVTLLLLPRIVRLPRTTSMPVIWTLPASTRSPSR